MISQPALRTAAAIWGCGWGERKEDQNLSFKERYLGGNTGDASFCVVFQVRTPPFRRRNGLESRRSFHVFHLAPSEFRLSSQLGIRQKKLCSTPTPVTHKLEAVLELRAWFFTWSLPVLSLLVMSLSRLGSELHPFQCLVWHSDTVKEPGLPALAECTTFGRLLALSEGTWGDFYGSWITMIFSMRVE